MSARYYDEERLRAAVTAAVRDEILHTKLARPRDHEPQALAADLDAIVQLVGSAAFWAAYKQATSAVDALEQAVTTLETLTDESPAIDAIRKHAAGVRAAAAELPKLAPPGDHRWSPRTLIADLAVHDWGTFWWWGHAGPTPRDLAS